MRIIEYGNKVERQRTCRNCLTKFAYANSDITRTKDKVFHTSVDFRSVKCPVCRTKQLV